MSPPKYVALHVMKTAGTSLRGMLIDGLGEASVYPNEADLDRRHKGWYPGPQELIEDVRNGRSHEADLVIGHLPYVAVDELPGRPRTVTLLREPVARAVSMMEHRSRSRRYAGWSYEQLLDDETFVEAQIRDYQTKMFAFDRVSECSESVNVPLEIDDARLARAHARLEAVDVLGVVERLPAFTERLWTELRIRVGEERLANRGGYGREPLSPDVRRRLEALTARDAALYRRACELVDAPSGPRVRQWRRWVRR